MLASPRSASQAQRCCAIVLSLALCAATATTAAAMYDCGQHEEFRNPKRMSLCLQRMAIYPEEFEVCKRKLCYLFLREPPFIVLDYAKDSNKDLVFSPDATEEEQIANQILFPCGDPGSKFHGLTGIAFAIHNATTSDALCVWAGEACTFNAAVDFTRSKSAYQLAITGLLLETEERQCFHDPGAPIVDNSMLIVGESNPENGLTKSAVFQLREPFEPGAWAVFGVTVLAFLIACLAIAGRFSYRGRSLITAFFVFAGQRDEAVAHESALHPNQNAFAIKYSQDGSGNQTSNLSFTTKYGMSMALFRIALLAFIGVFVLFYEVAVVNVLFTQQSRDIGKSVTKLTANDLQQYSVLKDSALEKVWARLVNPDGIKFDNRNPEEYPWRRCPTATQCIAWAEDVNDEQTKFDVTFEIVGKYLINKISDCKRVTVFETEDVLYQFNAGWLYNRNVSVRRRQAIDRELVGLRIDGTIRREIDKYISDFSCKSKFKTDVGPMIVLLPIVIFVLPPLLTSVLILLCWKTKKKENRKDDRELQEESSLTESISAEGNKTTRSTEFNS